MPDLAPLAVGDFDAFLTEVHGGPDGATVRAFPWQRQLLEDVVRDRTWPQLLALPTGAGKTVSIDIAVFSLAIAAEERGGGLPRRIAFCVDRRTIVQQAAVRARAIRDALTTAAAGSVAATVAGRLAHLCFDDPTGLVDGVPLQVAELRGGIARDDAWACRPDVPSVLVSTVDQIGSRLLFRGYGVSDGMKPIHAGLIGNDTLILLDEVHLSEPFRQTLTSLRRRRPKMVPDRWQVVQLSATPAGDVEAWPFDPRAQGPLFARRYAASKPLRMVEVKGSTKAPRAGLPGAAAAEVDRLSVDGAEVIGVIVNRVATAVETARVLAAAGRTTHLVTGRMRPIEREHQRSILDPLVLAGRPRPAIEPVVLVATQTVEAGADLDLDAVVTECASLDALRQRFGRVDRLGDGSASGRAFASVVLGVAPLVKHDVIDAVYGGTAAATWRWLIDEAIDDVGIAALEARSPTGAEAAALRVELPDAPRLLSSHLDRFVQTAPRPDADPDPADWLHGTRPQDPDVNIVWRADLDVVLAGREFAGRWDGTDGAPGEVVASLVAACPPSAGEAMSVPLAAARRWLRGALDVEVGVADVEGVASEEADAAAVRSVGSRFALRWAGDASELVDWTKGLLRPGDTIVVPCSWGGITALSWDPSATSMVTDLRLGAVDREPLLAARIHAWETVLAPALITMPNDDDGEEVGPRKHLLVALTGRLGGDVLAAAIGPAAPLDADVPVDAPSTDDDTGSFRGVAVPLATHLRSVEAWAGGLARACGLSPALAGDLALAGRLHDLGKIDPRFQRMLGGGVTPRTMLAKSGLAATDRKARMRASADAGYPRGERHEALSLALIESHPAFATDAEDWDLVRHLVVTHHGRARPFLPVPAPSAPAPVAWRDEGLDIDVAGTTAHEMARLGSGVPERFWAMVERYGWYGLAWLEAIFRLADHRASESDERRVPR